MSTWRHVGMTYLKYADLCATHVTNCLKEPRKSKALSSTAMHVRVMAWEGGKKQKPGVRPPHRAKAARRALPSRWRRGLVRSLTLVAAPPPPRRDCREGGGDWLADFLNAACVRGMPGRWVRVFERPSCRRRAAAVDRCGTGSSSFSCLHTRLERRAPRKANQGPDKTYTYFASHVQPTIDTQRVL